MEKNVTTAETIRSQPLKEEWRLKVNQQLKRQLKAIKETMKMQKNASDIIQLLSIPTDFPSLKKQLENNNNKPIRGIKLKIPI